MGIFPPGYRWMYHWVFSIKIIILNIIFIYCKNKIAINLVKLVEKYCFSFYVQLVTEKFSCDEKFILKFYFYIVQTKYNI